MKELARTCKDILDQEISPLPNQRNEFISQATTFPTGVDQSSAKRDIATDKQDGSLPSKLTQSPLSDAEGDEIPRATVVKANTKLTAHTVESLLWGAELGWTTLTANRTSVKAILKEMKIARLRGRLDGLDGDSGIENDVCEKGREEVAAIWIVDPRSLAEQMSGGSSNF